MIRTARETTPMLQVATDVIVRNMRVMRSSGKERQAGLVQRRALVGESVRQRKAYDWAHEVTVNGTSHRVYNYLGVIREYYLQLA
jgi:hypothetical protein